MFGFALAVENAQKEANGDKEMTSAFLLFLNPAVNCIIHLKYRFFYFFFPGYPLSGED